MQGLRVFKTKSDLRTLLDRDHTVNGGMLFGLDGHLIEIQARAISQKKGTWRTNVDVIGMPSYAAAEGLARITGAFAKLRIPAP